MYTLTYFDGLRGRGEPIRFILEDLQVPYENVYVTFPEWASLKTSGVSDGSVPFGQLPTLKDGDVVIAQTQSILRYLARKHNLYGTDDADAATTDMIAEHAVDGFNQFMAVARDPNGGSRIMDFLSTDMAGWMNTAEKFYSRRGGPYACGASVTYGDFYVFLLLEVFTRQAPQLLEGFPRLLAFFKAMARRPNISAYLTSGRRKEHMYVPMTSLDNAKFPVSAAGASYVVDIATSSD